MQRSFFMLIFLSLFSVLSQSETGLAQGIVNKVLSCEGIFSVGAGSYSANAEITENENNILRNNFSTLRGLYQYFLEFSSIPEFSLQSFLFTFRSAKHRWLDSGAGAALAQAEYLRSLSIEGQANNVDLVAVSVRKPLWTPHLWNFFGRKFFSPNSIKYFSGKKIEERKTEELGLFDLITDVFGSFMYASDPSVVLNKYLSLLNRGGRIYLNSDFRTSYKTSLGEPISLLTLMQRNLEPDFRVVDLHHGSIMIERLVDSYEGERKFPPLDVISFKATIPPSRIYRVSDQ